MDLRKPEIGSVLQIAVEAALAGDLESIAWLNVVAPDWTERIEKISEDKNITAMSKALNMGLPVRSKLGRKDRT